MATRITTVNLQKQKRCQDDINAKLGEWRESGFDAKTRIELDKLYEDCSNFSADCPVCIAGRADFNKALGEFKSGNLTEGLARMKNSFASVRFKWSMFRDTLSR